MKFGSAVMAAVAALTLSRRFGLIGWLLATGAAAARLEDAARFVALGGSKPPKVWGGLAECWERCGVENKSWGIEKGNFQGEEESKGGWTLLAKGNKWW